MRKGTTKRQALVLVTFEVKLYLDFSSSSRLSMRPCTLAAVARSSQEAATIDSDVPHRLPLSR